MSDIPMPKRGHTKRQAPSSRDYSALCSTSYNVRLIGAVAKSHIAHVQSCLRSGKQSKHLAVRGNTKKLTIYWYKGPFMA
eukprot:3355073-Pleurochrysis_carterae.AAC.1